jgi:hypothetical protein
MFLSVNGKAPSYGTARDVPSRYTASTPAARHSFNPVLIRTYGQLY